MGLFRRTPKRFGREPRQRRPSADLQPPSSFSLRDPNSERSANPARSSQPSRPAPAVQSFRSFWLQRIGHLILLVAIVASAINILTLSSNARVLPLTTGGSIPFLHSQAAYQQAADRLLAGSVWNRNKVTINTEQIRLQMITQFPELADVSVTLPLLAHRPIIYLQPSQPALVLEATNGSFVLDTTGKALLSSNQLPNAEQLKVPVVRDQSGLQPTLNRRALTGSYVSFIQTVVAQLNAQHLNIAALVLPPHSSELDVSLTGQPYFIKFNLANDDARQQVGTFMAVIGQLQTRTITPAHYVDVRVGGRAYYQ